MNAVIFGCGWQGMRHVKILKELSVNLECIVDINPKGVYNSFPDFPKNNIYEDTDLCFKNHKPDVAIIATDSASRIDCVKKSVEYGVKKIFCEKPMATNLNDAATMIKITEENGCLLAINHLRRWSPNHIALKKLLDKGIIGTIKHIYFQSGSTGLGNVVSHIIDNIRFYTDSELEWVLGFLDKTGTPNIRGSHFNDPAGWGMILMKDGTRIFIDTFEDTGVPHVFEIVGTFGRVVIEEMNNHWHIFTRKKSDWEIPLTKYPTPLHEVDFIKTIPWDVSLFSKNGLKNLIYENKIDCTGYDGYKAIEGIIAMHISDSNNGGKIKLPLIDEHMNFNVPWA